MSAEPQNFIRFEAYDFDNDVTFQNGLSTILEKHNGKSQTEIETLIEETKCFYYSKRCEIIDYESYVKWKRNKPADVENSIPPPTMSSGSSVTSESPRNDGSNGGEHKPQYPRSFQEICELIASGKSIPVKHVPNEINKEPPKEAKIKPQPKPWEKKNS